MKMQTTSVCMHCNLATIIYSDVHISLELNPDPNNLPELDPKDQFLLGDTTGASFTSSYGGPVSASQSSLPSVPNVTWLRKTEYLSKEIITRGGGGTQDTYLSSFA